MSELDPVDWQLALDRLLFGVSIETQTDGRRCRVDPTTVRLQGSDFVVDPADQVPSSQVAALASMHSDAVAKYGADRVTVSSDGSVWVMAGVDDHEFVMVVPSTWEVKNPLPVVLERGNGVMIVAGEPHARVFREVGPEAYAALQAWAAREIALGTVSGTMVYAVGEVSCWAVGRDDLRESPDEYCPTCGAPAGVQTPRCATCGDGTEGSA